MAQLLISQKANVDAPAQLHLTPLMEAARRGHWDVARLLVKHHCDLDALDDLGRPALVQATLRGGNVGIDGCGDGFLDLSFDQKSGWLGNYDVTNVFSAAMQFF